MAQEIERKFLVKDSSYKEMAVGADRIKQGYICSEKGRTVRVRIRGDKGILTIKGASNTAGTSRYEWERELPLEEGEELMGLCDANYIDKTRYLVDYKGHLFEVDEFYGANEGLVMAEVELQNETEMVEFPPFIGEEVTGDVRYYNSSLMKFPFSSWRK